MYLAGRKKVVGNVEATGWGRCAAEGLCASWFDTPQLSTCQQSSPEAGMWVKVISRQ